jgi:hypothetical protein
MMPNPTEDKLLEVLFEIRNWVRLAAHGPAKAMLKAELPDKKSRAAYQMFDGTASFEQVRVACKMSPNSVVALANRCVAAGLMEVKPDKKRARLFNLADFGLLDDDQDSAGDGK